MSALGNFCTGNPKSMTQLDATRPQRTSLIGICKKWFSEWIRWGQWGCRVWQQRLLLPLASTLLASFAEKHYTTFRRARTRTPNASHGFRRIGASGKISYPPYIAMWASLEDNPWCYSYSDHERNIADSLHSEAFTWIKSKAIDIPAFILEDITGAISVAYPIVSFFWDITRKRDLFGYRIWLNV